MHTRELGRTVVAPLLVPGSAPFDLHPQNAMPATGRSYGGDAPPVDISGKPFPPGLPDAVLDVLVHQFFVQTMVETCDRVQPAYADRYHGGVRNWRDRNSDILAKSNRILFSRFTGEQRDLLRATGRARFAQLLPPPDATQQDKIAWCDRMSTGPGATPVRTRGRHARRAHPLLRDAVSAQARLAIARARFARAGASKRSA